MQKKIIEIIWHMHDILKIKKTEEYILLKNVEAKVL